MKTLDKYIQLAVNVCISIMAIFPRNLKKREIQTLRKQWDKQKHKQVADSDTI